MTDTTHNHDTDTLTTQLSGALQASPSWAPQPGWSLDAWRPTSLAPSQQRAVDLAIWLLTGELPDHGTRGPSSPTTRSGVNE